VILSTLNMLVIHSTLDLVWEVIKMILIISQSYRRLSQDRCKDLCSIS